MKIAVVGAGFSGIGITAQLRKAGHTDVTVYERGDDVGGVWRDNTYPGAACDVPSHLYSFSFAPDGRWSKRFAQQHEIYAYLQRVAREHGVLPHVRLGTEVRTCTWRDGQWHLELGDGSTDVADVVITACGQLSRPAYPPVDLSALQGPVFHSAEWRHDVDLTGKRVVVVGTGASAIQFVPEVVKVAGHVTVVQRTPPHVIPKPDRDYSPRAKAVLERFPLVLKADRLRTYLANEARTLGFNTDPRLMKPFERKFTAFLEQEVTDPELRAKLVPDYRMGCKRILQTNDWLHALTRPHVDVVTSPVQAVTSTGVVTADGVTREADAVILGTGFKATDLLVPMEVTGPHGTLADAWADGAEAHLGTVVAGFPNFFVLYGPNTNLGHNSIVYMLESQFGWVLQAVELVRRGRTVEVRPEVQQRYNAWVQERLKRTVFAQGCRSWYQTAAGKNTANWPASTLTFRRRLRRLDPQDLL